MFHPQPLAMFLSLLAFWITARMIVRSRLPARLWIALAMTLAAAQLVRSVSIWTVGVILVDARGRGGRPAGAPAADPRTRSSSSAVAAVLVAAALVHPPAEVDAQRGLRTRDVELTSFDSAWPAAFYVSPGLPDVITHPQRAELEPRFFPLLYADTWGDYFGIWSWGPPRPELTSDVNRRLAIQSIVGLPLTALPWPAGSRCSALGATRWREAPARLLVALAPLVGLAAVLYYATRSFRADGDTVKAMFMLPAVPFWALSFGFAVDVLRRSAVAGSVCPCSRSLALCGSSRSSFATFAFVS